MSEQGEKRPLLLELAHLVCERSKLEVKRDSARYKCQYYRNIKKAVKRGESVDGSKKWKGKSRELNSLILKHEADKAKWKYKISVFTCKNNKRVLELCKLLGGFVEYRIGRVVGLRYNWSGSDYGATKWLFMEDLHSLSKEHEANLAIEKMING